MPESPARWDTLDEGPAFHHKTALRRFRAPTDLAAPSRSPESTMPKMKTNRAANKRFRVTGSGKIRRPKGGAQHNMIGKSRKRRRRLRDNDIVASGTERRIKILLPYG